MTLRDSKSSSSSDTLAEVSSPARPQLELIAKWRERARLNAIPPNTDASKWAWKNVGIAQQQCADELQAALAEGAVSAAPPASNEDEGTRTMSRFDLIEELHQQTECALKSQQAFQELRDQIAVSAAPLVGEQKS